MITLFHLIADVSHTATPLSGTEKAILEVGATSATVGTLMNYLRVRELSAECNNFKRDIFGVILGRSREHEP